MVTPAKEFLAAGSNVAGTANVAGGQPTFRIQIAIQTGCACLP